MKTKLTKRQFQKDLAALAKIPMPQFVRVLDKMKTPTPKAKAPRAKTKLPRGRVMFCGGFDCLEPKRLHPSQTTVAVLPFSTGKPKQDAKQARAFVRFWNMPEEERVDAVACAFMFGGDSKTWDDYKRRHGDWLSGYVGNSTRAVLAAISGEAQP